MTKRKGQPWSTDLKTGLDGRAYGQSDEEKKAKKHANGCVTSRLHDLIAYLFPTINSHFALYVLSTIEAKC